jgi:hypothetical protein
VPVCLCVCGSVSKSRACACVCGHRVAELEWKLSSAQADHAALQELYDKKLAAVSKTLQQTELAVRAREDIAAQRELAATDDQRKLQVCACVFSCVHFVCLLLFSDTLRAVAAACGRAEPEGGQGDRGAA